MDLLATISKTLERQQLIRAGDLVLLAVSGGPDSLAMLYALTTLRSRLDFQIHIAHLDHQLRPESAAEASFVFEQAALLNLPVTITRVDVAAEARRQRLNEYAAGRLARYQMLGSLAIQLGANRVAVAHTANDQAETVLLHLLRGAGSEGLAAMAISTPWEQWSFPGVSGVETQDVASPHQKETQDIASLHHVAPALIRPLLEASRAQVEEYCRSMGLEPRHDPSNLDIRHVRSRIRYELIPRLMEYNPHIIEALCRTADICAADQDFIEEQLDQIWQELVQVHRKSIEFKGSAWQQLPLALQRAALRRAHAILIEPGKTLELSHISEICRLITTGVGHQSMLPGAIVLEVGYGQDFRLRTAQQDADYAAGPQLQRDSIQLTLPARIDLEGWLLEVTLENSAQVAQNHWELWLDAEAISDKMIIIRRRKAGDRMRPAGAPGSRSIQDMMVDAKLPRELRAAWPLLVLGEKIIWITGLRAAEGAACIPGKGPALWVRVRDSRAEAFSFQTDISQNRPD